MSSFFKLVLDTTAPALGTFALDGEEPITGTAKIPWSLAIEDEVGEITGYQYKIWGDVDPAANEHIQETEEESDWITLGEGENVPLGELTLSSGDGAKTVKIRVRDDVWNLSEPKEASIELDTTVPTITITAGPTPGKISEIAGKEAAAFTWKASEDISEFEIRQVPAEGSNHSAGSLIEPGGEVAGETNQEATINGTILHEITGTDGQFIIKVFGKSKTTGLWSL